MHHWLRFLLSLVMACGLLGEENRQRPWTSRPTSLQFQHLSVSHGLSQSTVYAILQDKRGFLWFGTEDGLNRYDGTTFRPFRREDGNNRSLRANWITCLLEDRNGSLWVGTMSGGLHRYDRDHDAFQRVSLDPSNPEAPQDITTLAEDKEGNLWIGTYGSGLALFSKDQVAAANPIPQVFLPNPEKPGSLPGFDPRAILCDRQGRVWLGFQDGGLAQVKRSAASITFQAFAAPSDGTAPRNINAIGEDSHGVIWIGCEQGFFSLQPGQTRFQRHLAKPGIPGGLGKDHVRRIVPDRAGTLWIGTDGGGLHRMLPRSRPEDPPQFRRFVNDARNPFSLSSNAIESIYEDRSNVLWVGCYVAGLNKVALSAFGEERERSALVKYLHNPSDSSSLSGNAINAILVDRFGSLWVGTEAFGLNRAISKRGGEALSFERFRAAPGVGSLQDDVVTCLYEDRQGRLWGGGVSGGLFQVEGTSPGQRPRFTHYQNKTGNSASLRSNFVNCIREDSQGNLWVGSMDGGLSRFDPATGKVKGFSIKDENLGTDTVDDIREDRFGTLWLATFNGIARFRPDSGEVRVYRPDGQPGSLNYGNVLCLHIDPEGVLWAGTNGAGLNRMEIPPWNGAKPFFTRVDPEAGIPATVITSIEEGTQGLLWVSTSRALYRYDRRTLKGRTIGVQDQIKGNEFLRRASFKTALGELFFGGTRGLNLFHPDDITINSTVPALALTDFQLFNQSVPVGKPFYDRKILDKSITESSELTLLPGDTVVTFTFAALHFVAPEHNQYQYRLEGLEDRWSLLGNRNLLTFTTLPSGTYTLRVKGSNSDGLWNEEGLSLRIRVLPPWYQTWWFITASIVFGIALVGGGVKWRLAQLEKNTFELETRVTQRTEALALANARLHEINRQKEKLTAMLVHDLRSPLTAIMGTLDIMEEEQTLNLRLLGRARVSIRHMITMLNDMLEVFRTREGGMPLDLAKVDAESILVAVRGAFEVQCSKKGITLLSPGAEGLPEFTADPGKVERALSNLLGNALKYTPQGGTITVIASHEQNTTPPRISFEVSDTGSGIAPDQICHIFDPYRQASLKDANLGVGLGLAIVSRIMEAHQGEVRVSSILNQGTTFKLSFPLVL
ncbi:MAG: two-component regulator propeller domain-containing protein [Holophaga sp.]|nr:two-component regulator propeller domain-containing protein [Holophaga sp.]